MIVKLIKIGNSLGIRLPKAIIEECHLQPELILIPKERLFKFYVSNIGKVRKERFNVHSKRKQI